jgi:NAD(P)-dependent dehydrogenase (short-subunit alcohol dehydrogenase family)
MTATAPRVVCISGGTSGIGAGIVEAFLEAGDRVLTFGRDPGKVAMLAERWGQAVDSGALRVSVGDVDGRGLPRAAGGGDPADRGRLDVLVNNAGVIRGQGDIEETVEAWRSTLEVNLIAPFALTQSCVDLLALGAAPSVINISSACAQHPFETCTSGSYSASKAGLDMLTRRLAMALGARGIRVNGVAPGVVEVADVGRGERPGRRDSRGRHRLGQEALEPRDVAEAVLFLASDRARRITGAC